MLMCCSGEEGLIDHVEIDTAFHMGNFPMVCPRSAREEMERR